MAPATQAPRWRACVVGGILFELSLLALCALLPNGTSIGSIFRSFVFTIHLPLMILAAGIHDSFSGILVLFLTLGLMALIWSFPLYGIWRFHHWLQSHFIDTKKFNSIVRFSLWIAGVLVLGITVLNSIPPKPRPFRSTDEIRSTVEGNTAFALDLYHRLKEKPGNLFFSPYSISSSLAMTSAGAKGTTETEMRATLHLNLDRAKLHPTFHALEERMDAIQRWNQITLVIANAMWCQQDYHFEKDFLKITKADYNTKAGEVDFRHSPAIAANEVNRWVEEKTKGTIKTIIEPGKLTEDSRLILCSAIYFKGKWQTQFKTGDTRPAPFFISTNQSVTVPMMRQQAEFKLMSDSENGFAMIELPYVGDDLSMIILLPSMMPDPDGVILDLSALEQKLTSDNLHNWLYELDHKSVHKVTVQLPRFTFVQSFDLSEVLKVLGMPSAFSTSSDFSGMDGTKNLFISDLIHKAFVEVNESGTVASATTIELAKARSQIGRFIADHPFVFLIREKGSGSVLFLGRLINPLE